MTDHYTGLNEASTRKRRREILSDSYTYTRPAPIGERPYIAPNGQWLYIQIYPTRGLDYMGDRDLQKMHRLRALGIE